MTLHSLEAILIITILGIICGAHNWVEIEQWGQARQAWLSEFLELPHGLLSHDTFGRTHFRVEGCNTCQRIRLTLRRTRR